MRCDDFREAQVAWQGFRKPKSIILNARTTRVDCLVLNGKSLEQKVLIPTLILGLKRMEKNAF